MGEEWNVNKTVGSLVVEVIDNRIKVEALLKTLIDSKVISEEDFNENYRNLMQEKAKSYADEIADYSELKKHYGIEE